VDNFTNAQPQIPLSERPEIDRWIISLLNTLVNEVKEAYENWDVTSAGRKIQDFVGDNLSNWYVRLNRKRFWGGEMDADKLSAYQTLYSCLETISILSAPIAPFFMDRLFCDLNAVTGRFSENTVHLVYMPEPDEKTIDKALEERMELAQRASSMILALRRKVNIKVRQPLAKIMIPILDESIREQFELVRQLVLNEVNVKEVEYIFDTKGLITKRIKPNFKTLGKKYGKQMKEISNEFANFTQEQITEIESSAEYSFMLPTGQVTLTPEDVDITSEDMPGWLVAVDGKLTIALDITVSDELRREGTARELVNRIQNLRKESKFEVTDKVIVTVQPLEEIAEALQNYKEYICNQTLAKDIVLDEKVDGTEIEWDESTLKIKVAKVQN
jgi:isoleucyl-tRNA synthetase